MLRVEAVNANGCEGVLPELGDSIPREKDNYS
jgi:hypothetical protein